MNGTNWTAMILVIFNVLFFLTLNNMGRFLFRRLNLMKRCCVHEYYPRRIFWNCLSTKLDPSKKWKVVIPEFRSAQKLNPLRYKNLIERNFYRLLLFTSFPKTFSMLTLVYDCPAFTIVLNIRGYVFSMFAKQGSQKVYFIW